MARKIIQNHTRESKSLVTNIKREQLRLPVFSSPNLLNQIKAFTQHPDKNYYLGFGGLGDALLLMAVCWNDPNAKIVFFANQIPFIRSFFEIFGLSVYLHDNVMGTKMANQVYDLMKVMPNFKSSAHLADGLDFNDWANEKKYATRIKGSAPWIGYLGQEKFDMPVAIIAPSGSSKEIDRQRYLHHHEYQQLVDIYLNQGFRVYATGSMADLHHFKLINKRNFYWLSSNGIYRGDGVLESCSLTKMLRIINSATQVISMDTWLKTYTLLCGIPTTVIETRWNNKYKSYGEDVTDWIFLNYNIWPSIKIAKIETLLA
jgi:hypothetical protein